MDDFGSQGEWPVHPELLDWLAVEFMDSGWDVKALQKTIVMSATYRQSSHVTPELLAEGSGQPPAGARPALPPGPGDDSRSGAGRLRAAGREGRRAVREAVPARRACGRNSPAARATSRIKGDGLYRRSLYTYWKRTVPPPFMVNFDSPNREQCTVFENRTNTPLQALDLMNDVTFLEASRKLAERMMTEGGASAEARIELRLSPGAGARARRRASGRRC